LRLSFSLCKDTFIAAGTCSVDRPLVICAAVKSAIALRHPACCCSDTAFHKQREFIMKNTYGASAILIVAGLLLLHCGCSKETRLQRVPMHGAVTMKSGELLNGSITYIPAEGQKGPSATATLKEGKYEFDRTNGPAAGPHTVTITRIVTREDSMKALRSKKPPMQSGVKWTFSAEVADDGQCTKDFAIDQ
jgi:hypothetical protein